jgi:disulfide bond formation protein DsbB
MKGLMIVGFALMLTLALACTPASRETPGAVRNTTGGSASLGGDAGRGRTLFSSSCTACHGPDAKGLPNLGKDLTTSAFVKSQTDPQLLAFIKRGRPASDPANTTGVDMPPKGGNPVLTDANLGDIIAFIRSVNH